MPPDRGYPVMTCHDKDGDKKISRPTWWEVTKQLRMWNEELVEDTTSDLPESMPQEIRLDIHRISNLGPFEYTFISALLHAFDEEKLNRLNDLMFDIEEFSGELVKFLQLSTWVRHGTNKPIPWIPPLHRSAVRAHLGDAVEKFVSQKNLAVPRTGRLHPSTVDLVRDFSKISEKPNPAELQLIADCDAKIRPHNPNQPPPSRTYDYQIGHLFAERRREMYPRHVLMSVNFEVLMKAFNRSKIAGYREGSGDHPMWSLRELR